MELILSRKPHDEAWKLYEQSFPYCERRGRERHNEVLNDPNFFPYHIMENEEFVGLLYYWVWDDIAFGEHLATRPELRGGGYGAKAVKAWQELVKDKTLMLEIEDPVDELTSRRRHFYLRQGMLDTSFWHMHPSYREPKEPHKLLIMSYPNVPTQSQFDAFLKQSLAVL